MIDKPFPSLEPSVIDNAPVRGDRITFIKTLRARYPGLGLKDAKDVSDWLEEAMRTRGYHPN